MTTEEFDIFRKELAAGIAVIEKRNKEAFDNWEATRKAVERSYTAPLTIRNVLAEQKALIDRPKINGQGTHVSFELSRKVITGITVQVPQWTGDVAGLPMAPLAVRSLIPTVPTSQGSVEFLKKTTYDNQAAPVAEGAAKPESTATYVPTTIPVEKIAHYIKLSKETYDDLPSLVAELELELIWGVQMKEEQQILKGTGVRPELSGIYAAAPAAPSLPTGTSLIDQVGAAIGVLSDAGYQPNGIVLNGSDWTAAQQAKAIANGQYLLGSPTTTAVNVLWGVRVVVSPVLAAGEYLVGDFRQGARLYEREAVNVTIATQNQDDFLKNLVTALAELREALVIRQVSAFLKNGPLAATSATARK